uniref:Uncharacterized protein n=1 Tax=viral metagenome TaxID=1070528 RepID=A0A6M3K2M7_9ZZZZ
MTWIGKVAVLVAVAVLILGAGLWVVWPYIERGVAIGEQLSEVWESGQGETVGQAGMNLPGMLIRQIGRIDRLERDVEALKKTFEHYRMEVQDGRIDLGTPETSSVDPFYLDELAVHYMGLAGAPDSLAVQAAEWYENRAAKVGEVAALTSSRVNIPMDRDFLLKMLKGGG